MALIMKREEQERNGEPQIEVYPRKDSFSVEYDRNFWKKVHQKQNEGFSWTRAMDDVCVECMIQKYKDSGQMAREDPALLMLKQWPAAKQYKNNPEDLSGLEQMVNRYLEVLLDSEVNSDNRYETFRDKTDRRKKTLLHYAAELGFLHVTKTLVKRYPLLLSMKTVEPVKTKRGLVPLDLALLAENDNVAAYLVQMMHLESVQSLFSWRPEDSANPQPSFFSFKSIVENPNMKKTVVAVLDQMVNPHWPYLPKLKETYQTDEEMEGIEGAWRTITDDPLEYHFCYHILDGDEGGRPPLLLQSNGEVQTINEHFNPRDKSCLHVIAKSKNMEALQHPVVRMLVKTKWKSYGRFFLSLQAALYVIFLLFLSYSLLHASTKLDPTQYRDAGDSFRGFCEIVSLVVVTFYFGEEINQMCIERQSYFMEWMTLFDWLGLLLVLCIIPLRYAGSKAQWTIASLAILFNFLRIFKFSSVTRTTGLYTKTLAKIIQQDLTRFMAVFAVVFLPFCGALFLSLRCSGQNHQFSGIGDVFLSGLRALSDQRPIAEDYSNFNWLSILLMLAYMGTVLVILLNILIAQMSTTYIQAKKVARVEYDVDRILQLTRMERFPFLNLRVKYYKEGEWISEKKLAEELLEFSEDRNPWESVEEKLNAIRDMMRTMVKQMRPGRK
nr:uncharacterized protein LOC131770347 [Pocillopora verrucosa]